MKRGIITAAALSILFCAGLVLGSIKGANGDIEREIDVLDAKFGNTLYEAFYSVEEVRAFSIIQLDRTANNYGYTRLIPEKTAAELTPSEKETLRTEMAEYLADLDSGSQVLEKIKSWISCKNNFESMMYCTGISIHDLLKIIKAEGEAGFLFAGQGDPGSIIIDNLRGQELNKLYHDVINYIAELETDSRFRCYAAIYTAFAEDMAARK